MTGRAVSRPAHPLYLDVRTPHRVVLPVLGVPVEFVSNARKAVDVVEASFARWRQRGGRAFHGCGPGLRVRLVVHDGIEGRSSRAPITYRLPEPDRVILHTPGSVGIADMRRREGVAYITSRFLSQTRHFCYGFLEPLVFVLVTQLDRHPVHAAVVASSRAALVLSGPPGTGKSTLAYAALRAGYSVLTDDSAYVQVRSAFRLWGIPGRVLLPTDARRLFPELSRRRAERLPTGKTKMTVRIPRAARVETADGRVGVCLLRREGGPLRVRPAGPATLRASLWRGLGPQQEIHRATAARALHRLCARGGWRLDLSDDPRDALPHIERMMAELEAEA